MLTLEWEPVRRLLDEGIEDLMAAHWEEVAVDKTEIPFAPDWPRVFALEAQKILYSAALRRDGRLVGYNAFHVLPHIHYRHSTHAVNDVIYLDPDERGFAGIKLVKGTEALLKELGVVKVMYRSKMHVKIGARGESTIGDMLSHIGYRLDEEVFSKLI